MPEFYTEGALGGRKDEGGKERVEVRGIEPPGKEDLLWKDVDLFSLRAERKKWEKLNAGREGFIQSTR